MWSGVNPNESHDRAVPEVSVIVYFAWRASIQFGSPWTGGGVESRNVVAAPRISVARWASSVPCEMAVSSTRNAYDRSALTSRYIVIGALPLKISTWNFEI